MFLMIGLKPFLNHLAGASLLADIFFTGIVISGTYALSKTSTVFRLSCLLASAVIGLEILDYVFGKIEILLLLQIALSILFIIQTLIMILKHLIIEQEITADMIMGGACAFVLLGFAWAYAYYLLEIFHPNSLTVTQALNDDISDYIYYSFVTLTSVGYGDILAVSPQARGLAILEAIVGQLYLAIMVARLVSLHISSNTQHQ